MKGDTVRRSPLLIARSGILAWGCDSRPRVSATPTARRAAACADTRRFLAATVIFVTAALGACGSSSGSSSPGGQQPTTGAIRDRLVKAGMECTGYEESVGPDKPILVRQEAGCDHGGERLVLDTFNTNTARDSAVQIAQQFGGIMVVGDRWSVMADSEATAERVADVLGGEVV